MENKKKEDLLHWVSLAMIIDYLVDEYGFDELSKLVKINCFSINPSKQSSLKFLRKTPWAREQVEWLYKRTILEKRRK